jgi:hypothetical protein
MDSTVATVWHAFLDASPDKKQSLLHCLSNEQVTDFQSFTQKNNAVLQGIAPLEDELPRIHYSWFSPFLRTLTETEIKIFLTCLTPEQVKGLKRSLLFSQTLPAITTLGTTYLKRLLFQSLDPRDLLPVPCLPESPLNLLLDLNPTELHSLIDLLSMHDLSVEIRQIIETAKLKEIYSLLSKPQTAFLKTLIHKKEPVSFKKIGLANWDGDKENLRSILTQRGINRIAKAIYNEHPSLLWHLSRHLDVEQGQHLIKLCTSLDHPKAAPLLAQQVIDLIGSLKNHNPSHHL